MKTLSIIGCGKVGSYLAQLLIPHVHIVTLVDHTLAKASKIKESTRQGLATTEISNLLSSDLYMIATQDFAIEDCMKQLLECEALKAHQVVFHVSGALPSSVLAKLRQKGVAVASFHPIVSILETMELLPTFNATVEGDQEAISLLKEVFSFAKIFQVDQDKKLLYHASLVFASQFPLSIYLIAEKILNLCIHAENESIVIELMRKTCDNIASRGARATIGGPLARNDHEIIEREIEALEQMDPNLAKLYKLLTEELIRRAACSPELTAPSIEEGA